MARPARELESTPESRRELEIILKRRKQKSGLHLRARIILQYMEGWKIADIAKANKVSMTTVMRWKNRYLEAGVDGLEEQSRSGRPACYGQEFKAAVLAKPEDAPPAGFSQWDGALLASETGYSKHAIWRFLRSQRIRLARKRSWRVSTDPEFVPKADDIVGLSLLHRKTRLCYVDEKPNIQALERLTGFAASSDHKLVRALGKHLQA